MPLRDHFRQTATQNLVSLPTLPIWLTEDSAVSLDLEACYEDTCRTLRIR